MGDLLVLRHLIGGRIRSDLQYRTSFFLFMAAQAIIVSLELVAVVLLLEVTPTLGEWDRTEVLFLFALATLPFAIGDLLISSVERLTDHVRTGDFDRFLLRPTPLLIQLSGLEFELRRLGQVIPNVLVLAWAIANVDVTWTLANSAYLALTLICGTVVYSALWIMAASCSFWWVGADDATRGFTYGGRSANQYPLHLYPRWLRTMLGWIVPIAFVAYIPTLNLLDAPDPLGVPPWFAALPPAVAATTALAAAGVWRAGVRKYQSTGS